MDYIAERRQYPRFKVKNDILAVLKPYPVKLGQIMNISEGGVVFQFFGADGFSSHYTKIDFFVTQDEKEYSSLPITRLWAATVPNSPEKSLPTHQIGMRFDGLTNDQSILLKEFIALNTE